MVQCTLTECNNKMKLVFLDIIPQCLLHLNFIIQNIFFISYILLLNLSWLIRVKFYKDMCKIFRGLSAMLTYGILCACSH